MQRIRTKQRRLTMNRTTLTSRAARWLYGLMSIGLLIFLLMVMIWATILLSTQGQIYRSLEQVPPRPIAIVFGAAVWPGGQLSTVLAERVETGVDLYHAGKVRKLLMTGDNRFEWYNEPAAMAQYAATQGIPVHDIVYDYAGRRTYDSCYRARHIFGIERAILVTQQYHLPRAVYTCRQIGIDVVGVAADRGAYPTGLRFAIRELPALLLAWWETNITHPIPVMGEPIEITYE